MSQVRFVTASILGLAFECLLYGIFIPFLLTAYYVQWGKRASRPDINKITVFIMAFYGLMIPLHWVFSFFHALRGSLHNLPGEDVEAYFQNASDPFLVSKMTVLQTEVLIGNLIMIYRLYYIYGRNLAICFVPLVGSLGFLATVFGSTIENTRGYERAVLTPWATACFSVATFNSLCISSLIVIRLWKTYHMLLEPGVRIPKSPVARLMCVLVESAALWTILVAINLVLFLAQNNLRFTSLDMTGPVIGISLCLIIIGTGYAPEQRASHPPFKTAEFAVPTTSAALTPSGTTREDSEQRIRTQHSTIGQ